MGPFFPFSPLVSNSLLKESRAADLGFCKGGDKIFKTRDGKNHVSVAKYRQSTRNNVIYCGVWCLTKGQYADKFNWCFYFSQHTEFISDLVCMIPHVSSVTVHTHGHSGEHCQNGLISARLLGCSVLI